VTDRGQIRLALLQPTARRREWQLLQGEVVCARLRIPSVRSGASAEAAGRLLRIEPRGRLGAGYIVRDETTGEDIARLRRVGRRLQLELDGRVATWKHVGRKQGYGFVGAEGEPFLLAKSRSGIARISAELQIDSDLTELELLVAALLASYLLIRKHEETAASAAVTSTVVAS
jgi:hypothetical protein